MHARPLQSELALFKNVTMHLLPLDGSTDELPVRAEGPPVIHTPVDLRIARFAHADAHAAVRAYIQQDVDLAFAIAGNDHLVLSHVAHYVVAGVGDLGLVSQ